MHGILHAIYSEYNSTLTFVIVGLYRLKPGSQYDADAELSVKLQSALFDGGRVPLMLTLKLTLDLSWIHSISASASTSALASTLVSYCEPGLK